MSSEKPRSSDDLIKDRARALVYFYADDTRLKNYIEPERKGTAKGDPIGFSYNKLRSAIFMALFPTCYTLNDISDVCSVPVGTLRVWRTRSDYMEAVKEEAKKLGKFIARFIWIVMCEQEQCNPVINRLACVDENSHFIDVMNSFIDSISVLSDETKAAAHEFLTESMGENVKWCPPEILIKLGESVDISRSGNYYRMLIDLMVDALADPEKSKEMCLSQEDRVRTGDLIKRLVNELIDKLKHLKRLADEKR